MTKPKAKEVATQFPPVTAATPHAINTNTNVPMHSAIAFLTKLILNFLQKIFFFKYLLFYHVYLNMVNNYFRESIYFNKSLKSPCGIFDISSLERLVA